MATAVGTSAIGIIRVSGQQAFSIVQSLFKGRGELKGFKTHTAHYGDIFDPLKKERLDEAICLIMKGPRSYTGEDMVEIQSHGNPLILNKILSTLVGQGARLAEPGEFSRRAFLSGRLDLVQAEAVMEMIASQSEKRFQWALGQLKGQLSERVYGMRANTLSLLAQIEAAIDFSEEGLSFHTQEQMTHHIGTVLKEVQALLAGYEEGRKIRDGFTVAIVGRPNVGKSSLLNLLLQEDRAIVTPYPGTTRDLLQEWIDIEGLAVQLVDTAGYRKTDDPIESEGVRRSEGMIKKADLALLVLDGSKPIQEEDMELMDRIETTPKVIVVNKSDLVREIDIGWIEKRCSGGMIVSLSTLTTEGIDALKNEIKGLLIRNPQKEQALVALLRHKNALAVSEKALLNAMTASREGASWEFIAVDLREAADSLGEIVGETTTDDILDQIFNQFCIGK